MEKSTPIQAYRVEQLCDQCGEQMNGLGIQLPTMPPQFPHQCVNGHQQTFQLVYPAIAYKDIENVEGEWNS